MITTIVGATFAASHRDPVRAELHGHSYEVWAWFEHDAPRDALALQETLKVAVSHFDHKTLPDEMSRAEDIAAAILGLLDNCVRVRIWRPLERLGAEAHV